MKAPPRPPPRGFSLIELMVAFVIIGILAAVAYPAYISFVQRSRRADAAAVLTVVVQAQERYRSNRSTYASELSDLGLQDADLAKAARHYTVALAGVGASAAFTTGYEAIATVKSGSPQVNDTDCWTLAVRVEGANLSYLASDKTAGRDQSAVCWPR